MDDDLMGRLVANAGVDCKVRAAGRSGLVQFLHTRKRVRGNFHDVSYSYDRGHRSG